MALPGAGRLVRGLTRAGKVGKVAAPAMTRARAAAEALHTSANAARRPTARALKQLARANGGKMVGLKNQLKEVDSLERKIAAHMKRFGVSADEAAESINDSLRYTMRFSERSMTQGSQRVLAELEQQGYEVVRVKNYWVKGNSYKGVNVELRTPEGHLTELQFHTRKSFDVKMKTHDDYKISRNEEAPLELRQEAHDRMVELSERLHYPPEIDSLGQLSRISRPS